MHTTPAIKTTGLTCVEHAETVFTPCPMSVSSGVLEDLAGRRLPYTPHLPQNAEPGGFSKSQCGQCMRAPLRHGRASGRGRLGRIPAPGRDRDRLAGVSVFLSTPGFKRKARDDAGSYRLRELEVRW
jgi:hypothetical protein